MSTRVYSGGVLQQSAMSLGAAMGSAFGAYVDEMILPAVFGDPRSMADPALVRQMHNEARKTRAYQGASHRVKVAWLDAIWLACGRHRDEPFVAMTAAAGIDRKTAREHIKRARRFRISVKVDPRLDDFMTRRVASKFKRIQLTGTP